MSRRLMSQMNVVPYIDVMLVLLVIFMVTSHLVKPKDFGKKQEEVEHTQRELEQKATLKTIRDELNAKERELSRVESLKRDMETKQANLVEIINKKNIEIHEQEKKTMDLKSEHESLQKQLAQAKDKLLEANKEIDGLREKLAENRIPVAKSVEMCNERNYTMDIALTYDRKTALSITSFSEGWYQLPAGKCKTVQIEDAANSTVLLYEREGMLIPARAKFCMDINERFSIYDSSNENLCKGRMIPVESMAVQCVVREGQVKFIQRN